jgi:hypothetical protein
MSNIVIISLPFISRVGLRTIILCEAETTLEQPLQMVALGTWIPDAFS